MWHIFLRIPSKEVKGVIPMRKSLLALYSLSHLWVDLSCALLVFRTMADAPSFSLCLLLYNFCAFALQMPLGLLAGQWNRNGLVAASGCLLTALAFLLPQPVPAAVIAGMGNALFHLGGGMDVLNSSEQYAAALGVFVSPGALGLSIGAAWGRGGHPALWIAPAGLLALGAAIAWMYQRRPGPRNVPLDFSAPGGYGVLLPLFLVVVLRSYMGMNQSFPWKGEGSWAMLLALALVLGKTAGGFAMDALGPRQSSLWSLGAAGALYLFSALPLSGILAVFLFNMTMPVTLWAAARAMPGAKGFTFGLLTFALFLGFLPSFLSWPSLLSGPWAYAAAALVSLALLWGPLGKGVTRC